ncbi:MAG: sigma-54-dependent transcriptional regulator [Gemmatimonadales bacterium]
MSEPGTSSGTMDSASSSRDPLSIPPEIKASIRILLVDDERTLRESCASVLELDGYSVTLSGRGEEALDLVKSRSFDIILVDLYMSQVSGLEILRAALATNKDSIVVVMTGNPSVSTSIEALRAGAWDYLPKPFSATHLQVLVGRASHAVMAGREASQLRQQVAEAQGDATTLIGISPAFRRAVDLARKVAPTGASVFIDGESGTGKEVIAQFIHRHSRRAKKSIVALNCAALPEPLLESEMFGHRKGAFTGADRDKPGLLETAHGGTLFLDEITEMPMTLQAKLLRVIQDGVVRRVGAETSDEVDVRFISATNRDPGKAVEAGVLRGDLFYRLRVVPVTLPPLRKRLEDIPLLANHFLNMFWSRHRLAHEKVPHLTDEAITFLRSRPWRGNVRELQNVIEHVVVLAEPGHGITSSDIPLYDDPEVQEEESSKAVEINSSEPFHAAKDRVVAQFEREYLRQLTTRAGGNMSRAARLAGVDRTTLYRLMDKHQLPRSERTGGEDD